MIERRARDRASRVADFWLGWVFASLLAEVVAAVYFLSLRTVGVHVSVVLFGVLCAPALLVFPIVRRLAGYAPLFGAGGLLASLVPEPGVRAVLLGIGFAGVANGLVAAALDRDIGSRWLAGILYAWLLRAFGGSFDPMHGHAALLVGSAAITAAMQFGFARPESSDHGATASSNGLAFGAALFIVHEWFLGPTVIPLWASVDRVWQSAVVIAWTLGFGVRLPWPVPALGMALLAVGNGPVALCGGVTLAMSLPSAWSAALAQLARGGPRGVIVAFAVYLGLLATQVVAFGLDYVVGFEVYRPVLVLLAFVSATLMAMPVRKASVSLAWLPACVGLVAGVMLWILAPAPRPAADSPLAAMTWNVQQGFDASGHPNVDAAALVMRRERATLIGVVESDATRPVSGGRDPIARLEAVLGMHAVSAPDPRHSTFGLALLSAYPIVESRVVLRDRVAVLFAVVDVGGRELHVAVTHLGGPSRHRPSQARAVADILAGVDGPLVLLGDFNAVPGSRPIATITASGLVLADVGGQPTAAGETIDHVLTRGFVVRRARVVETGSISDHRAVIAELSFRRP